MLPVAVFVAAAAAAADADAVAPVVDSVAAVPVPGLAARHIPGLAAAADFVDVAVGVALHELSPTDACACLSSESARASSERACWPPAQTVVIVVLAVCDAVGGWKLAADVAVAAVAPATLATVGAECE